MLGLYGFRIVCGIKKYVSIAEIVMLKLEGKRSWANLTYLCLSCENFADKVLRSFLL